MVQLRDVHALASIISMSDPLIGFFIWRFVRDEVQFMRMLITLNEMKNQILTAATRYEQPLLKKVGHEEVLPSRVQATNGVNRA
jgi:hypothetical protein